MEEDVVVEEDVVGRVAVEAGFVVVVVFARLAEEDVVEGFTGVVCLLALDDEALVEGRGVVVGRVEVVAGRETVLDCAL